MPITGLTLRQLHLALLRKQVELHHQQFPCTQAQLQRAEATIDNAMQHPSTDDHAKHIHDTACQVLIDLSIKRPTRSLMSVRHKSAQLESVTHSQSPIIQAFFDQKDSIDEAFNLIKRPFSTPKKAPKIRALFSSPEHNALGNSLNIRLIDERGNQYSSRLEGKTLTMLYEEDGTLKANKNLHLTPGEIVFLSGDYFGIAKAPIADEKSPNSGVTQAGVNRFKAAYNTLAKSAKPKDIATIKSILNAHYSRNPTLNSYIQQLKLFLFNPGYGKLLNNNIDHFPPWSEQAYKTGHQAALELAKQAGIAYQNGDFKQARLQLQQAYEYDLYAQHYLSDTYAAGHLRIQTLRTELRDQFGLLGSALVNDMHNDDGDNGVKVAINGQVVTLKGDEHLNDPDNQRGKQLAQQAMQTSIDEIYRTFENKKLPTHSQVDRFIPKPIAVKDKQTRQTAPMFSKQDQQIVYRSPITELNPDKVTYKPLHWYNAFVILIMRRVLGVTSKYTPDTKPSVRASAAESQPTSIAEPNASSAITPSPRTALRL